MTKFNLGMQGWFNVKKAINIIHLINSLTQHQIAISGGTTKKHFDKSLHPFLTKDGSSFQNLLSTCPLPPRHGPSYSLLG